MPGRSSAMLLLAVESQCVRSRLSACAVNTGDQGRRRDMHREAACPTLVSSATHRMSGLVGAPAKGMAAC